MKGPETEVGTSLPADQRILAAAGRLFADRGFKETSIQVLAEEAGVNRALIFYYFQSKEALYRRLVGSAVEALARDLGEALQPGEPPLERLRTWVRVNCRCMARTPDLLRLLLREAMGPGPSVLPVGDYAHAVEAPLREILEEGQAQGVFRNLDLSMVCISLLGLLVAFFRRRYFDGQTFQADEVAEHILGLVLEGLLTAP